MEDRKYLKFGYVNRFSINNVLSIQECLKAFLIWMSN